MALFGSSKSTTPLVHQKVRPTVIRTNNISKELKNIATSYEVSVESLDFNIFDIQTYIRVNSGQKDGEWEEIHEDELYQLDEESALLNENFQIKQTYEVEIFSKNNSDNKYQDFKLAIGANATKCKIYLSILANSKIEYHDGFSKELVMMIKKRKLRAGILVGIFDEMLEDVISKISAHVRVSQKVVYTKNETILISQAYEPTPTIDDALVLHYDKKEDIDEKTKIDYASRGFIQNVAEGELLIEYVKPRLGKPGRNCRGQYIHPNEPTTKHEPTFNVDDTIKVIETENSIQYIANENGYIALDDNTYHIKTDVDVGEISFKTTGSIKAGLNSDVSINVIEADAIKDAVGMGMEVEVSEIEIDGNVGSNATVTAMKANIGGQTHKSATIRADKLDINVHKGKAYGKDIHITRLEHGEVNGEKVAITQAAGGIINAKEIYLEICASHVKATASKMIEIQKLIGSENIFTIDPTLKEEIKSDVDENKEEITKLQDSIKTLKKEIVKYSGIIKSGTSEFVDLKKRLVKYKKNGIKMPASLVGKYKQFQEMQIHLKNMKEEETLKTDKLDLLTTKTASFQDDIFSARVINRGRWIGYNEIRFKLIKPKIELIYKPKEGSNEKIFGLVVVDDGEFEIRALKE